MHRNVSKSSAMGRWTCSPQWPHGYRSQTMILSIRRILQFVAICSTLCMDGLLLHLVGQEAAVGLLGGFKW